MIALEVCVDTLQGARVAASAGAARIELCCALEVGGLTPSAGLMRQAAALGVPVSAMIRPRAGSFVFDPGEIDVMVDDIHAARDAGMRGVVLGALDTGRCLDRRALSRLISHSDGLGLTLHRAFDLVADPLGALESAIALGFDRILTSGGAMTALAGADRIAALDRKAAGRISIMPGSGITGATLARIVAGTAIREIHASCRSAAPAAAAGGASFGFGHDPMRTDPGLIAAILEVARGLSA